MQCDPTTVDLTRTRVRVCDAVRFVPQVHGSETFYHLELASGSEYFRVGCVEYHFLSLLNGHTSFCEALAITAQNLGADALSQENALQLYSWALERRVVEFTDTQHANGQPATKQPPTWQKLNPFWIRIPLGRPDEILKCLQPFANWLFHPVTTVVAVLFMILAGCTVGSDWERFSLASQSVLDQSNWLWMLFAWILLKVMHETAHGLVCRRYGGHVQETGIIFAFLAPLAYVDVSSCWAFRSRWQRIHTALAGMYVELLAASVAALIWSQTNSPVVSHLMYDIIFMASVSTLLFNANPLMRFDGYYVLSDLLQIPNLYTQSNEALRDLTFRCLFGRGETPAAPDATGRWLIIAYGVAALIWKLLICSTMVIAASVLFHGAGILLSALGVIAWFAVPLINAVRGGGKMARAEPARMIRGASLAGVLVAIFTWALTAMPVPFQNTAPGVVSLSEGAVVRSGADGFADRIYVTTGESVKKGQLLLSLRNEESELQLRDLQLQLEQEQLRHQAAMTRHDPAMASITNDKLYSLKQQLTEIAQQNSALEIRAPCDGTVLARQLNVLRGTYVHEGDELLIVDDLSHREFHISVSQEDFEQLRGEQGATTGIRIGSRPRVPAKLLRLIPRASRRLKHPSLAASEGGPLPVSGAEGRDEAPVLVRQRFQAVLAIRSDSGHPLVVSIGERGYLNLSSQHKAIGSAAYFAIKRWLSDQLTAARGDSQRY